ncbi:MAG: VanZ family protein [Chloroflexi bacterium]|nr:VanZ family protein [Chloroflexota bacterium]
MVARFLSVVLLVLPMAASVAWAVVIYGLSTDPTPPGTGGDGNVLDFLPRPDLFVHFGLYGIFGLLLIWSVLPLRVWQPLTLALRTGLPVVVGGVFGIAMELVQDTIPERSASVDDAVVDILGAIAAVVFVFVVRRVFHLGRSRSAA